MRKKLEEREGYRGTFIGKFSRKGFKNGYRGPEETILLTEIKDMDGNYITNHLWFNYTKGFQKLGELKEGDLIQFDARSKMYIKGYKGYRTDIYCPLREDYKLSHPSKIKIVK